MRRLVAALVVFGLLAGCGRGDHISDAVSAQLVAQVQAVRAAAERGDAVAATARLAELRQRVTQLTASGELHDAQAAKVLAASSEVEAQLGALPPASTTSAPTVRSDATTSTTDEQPPKRDEKPQKKAKDPPRKPDAKAAAND